MTTLEAQVRYLTDAIPKAQRKKVLAEMKRVLRPELIRAIKDSDTRDQSFMKKFQVTPTEFERITNELIE